MTRAITFGFQYMTGDAVVIMMADESDDCRDVVRYWETLGEGWDAVFGKNKKKPAPKKAEVKTAPKKKSAKKAAS